MRNYDQIKDPKDLITKEYLETEIQKIELNTNLDCGTASTVYSPTQKIDCGGA